MKVDEALSSSISRIAQLFYTIGEEHFDKAYQTSPGNYTGKTLKEIKSKLKSIEKTVKELLRKTSKKVTSGHISVAEGTTNVMQSIENEIAITATLLGKSTTHRTVVSNFSKEYKDRKSQWEKEITDFFLELEPIIEEKMIEEEEENENTHEIFDESFISEGNTLSPELPGDTPKKIIKYCVKALYEDYLKEVVHRPLPLADFNKVTILISSLSRIAENMEVSNKPLFYSEIEDRLLGFIENTKLAIIPKDLFFDEENKLSEVVPASVAYALFSKRVKKVLGILFSTKKVPELSSLANKSEVNKNFKEERIKHDFFDAESETITKYCKDKTTVYAEVLVDIVNTKVHGAFSVNNTAGLIILFSLLRESNLIPNTVQIVTKTSSSTPTIEKEDTKVAISEPALVEPPLEQIEKADIPEVEKESEIPTQVFIPSPTTEDISSLEDLAIISNFSGLGGKVSMALKGATLYPSKTTPVHRRVDPEMEMFYNVFLEEKKGFVLNFTQKMSEIEKQLHQVEEEIIASKEHAETFTKAQQAWSKFEAACLKESFSVNETIEEIVTVSCAEVYNLKLSQKNLEAQKLENELHQKKSKINFAQKIEDNISQQNAIKAEVEKNYPEFLKFVKEIHGVFTPVDLGPSKEKLSSISKELQALEESIKMFPKNMMIDEEIRSKFESIKKHERDLEALFQKSSTNRNIEGNLSFLDKVIKSVKIGEKAFTKEQLSKELSILL